MAINPVNLPGIFTRGVRQVYTDQTSPAGFLTSLAGETETDALAVGVEVRRGTEKIAADVLRGTLGNANQMKRSSVHEYIPPFYNEYISISAMDIYNRTFRSEAPDPVMVADLITQAGMELAIIADKINRAIELQWSQVFQTGVVTLVNGDNIDYRRKALSIVDVSGSGGYWSGTSTISANIETGCDFLNEVGKSGVGVTNMLMGTGAFNAFTNSPELLASADTRYIKLMNITMPTDVPNGGKFHGQYSVGSHIVNVYTYKDFYDVSGTATPYIDPTKVIMWPAEGTAFTTKFGGLPKIINVGGSNGILGGRAIAQISGKTMPYERIDQTRMNHEAGIMSAPLAVPVSIDKIYTMKVLA